MRQKAIQSRAWDDCTAPECLGQTAPPRAAPSRLEIDAAIVSSAEGAEQVIETADGVGELRRREADLVPRVGVGAGDGGEAAVAPGASGGLILKGAIAAVDAFDAVEELDHFFGTEANGAAAGGVSKVHERALVVAMLTEGPGASGAGSELAEAEGEDVTEVRGDFDGGNDDEVHRAGEELDLFPRPDAIVFGENDAIESTFASEGDELVWGHVGVVGEVAGVDVKVDTHLPMTAGNGVCVNPSWMNPSCMNPSRINPLSRKPIHASGSVGGENDRAPDSIG